MREALVGQAVAFSGRGHVAITDPVFQGTGTIPCAFKTFPPHPTIGCGFASGISWKVLQQFSVTTMKDLGWGSRVLRKESRRGSVSGAYLDPHFLFNSITANTISSIAFDEHFNYQDPQLLQLLHVMNEGFVIVSSFYSQRSDPESEFHQKNLLNAVLSLLIAGTETSSATLSYGFLLLLKNPDVFRGSPGRNRQSNGAPHLPALEERVNMPYTDAVIREIRRSSDSVPLGLPHSAIRDTHFRGYYLPKGTPVYSILSSALHDPRHFEKPDALYPGRFLDAQGKFKKPQVFIPSSISQACSLSPVGMSAHSRSVCDSLS
ncbi:hypothetical protein AB1E18_013444 [Capra hircus]